MQDGCAKWMCNVDGRRERRGMGWHRSTYVPWMRGLEDGGGGGGGCGLGGGGHRRGRGARRGCSGGVGMAAAARGEDEVEERSQWRRGAVAAIYGCRGERWSGGEEMTAGERRGCASRA